MFKGKKHKKSCNYLPPVARELIREAKGHLCDTRRGGWCAAGRVASGPAQPLEG